MRHAGVEAERGSVGLRCARAGRRRTPLLRREGQWQTTVVRGHLPRGQNVGGRNARLGLKAAADGASMYPPTSKPEEGDGKIGETAAVASVMKAVMGAGCFALPWAFANGGLALTTFSLAVMCLVCLKTLGYMFKARDAALDLDDAKSLSDVGNYVDISELTLGGTGALGVKIIMCLTCFGVCSAYLVFLASTMVTIAAGYNWPVALQNEKTMIYLVSPLMIALAYLRSMSAAGLISIFGNISVVVGMTFVLIDALKNPVVLSSLPMAVPSQFSAYVGSVAFLFLVHFALPDIEANMTERKNFLSAAAKGYWLCALICLAFGGIGALGYGPQVKSVAIAMLEGGVVAVTVKLLLCANVLATFPLIVRSSFATIENAFGGMSVGPSNIMRTLYVLAAAFCAASIPSFGKLVGLVGGVACTALGFSVPILMLYSVNKKSLAQSKKPVMSGMDRALSPLIMVFSIIVMAFVVITS
mmetsp:Transcript_36817/g.79693  ORF Transcript_36817/g.79693 Transcript_36817/m.79693 type:complete len:472 (-) Transcript_36817:103-1518(-)